MTLGEKLTVKAHEEDRKPVKDRRKSCQGADEGQACKRVEEGRKEQSKWLSEVSTSLIHLFVVDRDGLGWFHS